MRFLVRLLVNAVALYVAQALVPGIGIGGDWVSLLLVALVFGVLNAIVRPILKLLTCPLQALTLGLFTLVINAVMLLLTSWASAKLGLGFFVEDFWAALLGAVVVSIVSIVLSIFVRDDKEKKRRR
jgi:putative membrane protein